MLVLVPAGVLVVLILAAVAVDFTHLHLEQRELRSAAAAAANDAAAAAVDPAVVRDGRPPAAATELTAAEAVARASVAADGLDPDRMRLRIIGTGDAAAIEVTLWRRVDYIFAPAVPGAAKAKTVHATATARLVTR